MNIRRVLFLFLLGSIVMTSCKKEDLIDISHLSGKWTVLFDDPNLVVDGSISYTFNTDKTCAIYIYNALSNSDTTLFRTYVLSVDNKMVTLFDEDNLYTEQYKFTKLTANEMKWVNASPGDGNDDKKLIRH